MLLSTPAIYPWTPGYNIWSCKAPSSTLQRIRRSRGKVIRLSAFLRHRSGLESSQQATRENSALQHLLPGPWCLFQHLLNQVRTFNIQLRVSAYPSQSFHPEVTYYFFLARNVFSKDESSLHMVFDVPGPSVPDRQRT
jgi:hypothetical protein